MTRLDSARETADRTKETLAPYAANARDTALHYADEARQRVGPALEALGPKVGVAAERARTGAAHTAQSARLQFDKHVLPQLGVAFSSLPPDAQQNALRALHRAQEAALAARLSAAKVAGQTRSTVGPRVTQAVGEARAAVVPVAQEAQSRGAAAITALQGHVTAAQIGELAAKNVKKEQRNGWATGLAIAGTLAVGSGLVAWQWWRRQGNPEWLVEPTVPGTAHSGAHATGGGSTGTGTGSTGTGIGTGTAASNGSGTGPTTGGPNGGPNGGPSGGTDGGPTGGTSSPLNGSPSAESSPGAGTGPTAGDPDPGEEHPKPHDPRKPH